MREPAALGIAQHDRRVGAIHGHQAVQQGPIADGARLAVEGPRDRLKLVFDGLHASIDRLTCIMREHLGLLARAGLDLGQPDGQDDAGHHREAEQCGRCQQPDQRGAQADHARV